MGAPDMTRSGHDGAPEPTGVGATTVESLIGSIPFGVSVWTAIRDEDGAITDFECCAANGRATGYVAISVGGAQTVVGQRFHRLFDDDVGRAMFQRFCWVVDTGDVDTVEREAARFPGLWFENVAARFGDGFVNLIRDITERRSMTATLEESEHRLRLAEQRAKESERQYRLVVDHVGDVVITLRHGLIEWVSPSLERLAGWIPEEVIGRDSMEFIHPDDHVLADEAEWSARQSTRLRLRVRHKDGRWFWVDLIGRIAGPDDEDTHPLVITIIDARAEVAALEALERAGHERERLDEQIRESARLESLSQLAGGIAHDFNNLLVGVLGNAELALEDLSPTSPIRGRLESLSAAALHAAELTRQLLDFTGRQPRERIALEVRPLISDTVDLVRSMASRTITIVSELETDAHRQLGVLGDRSQLQQVVMNLLMNAHEATEQGSGAIQVQTSAVMIDDEAADLGVTRGRYVSIEISDNGRGIPPEHHRRIFDPFFTTRTDGRGLGLAVVSGIVRSHHGAVQVRSHVGQGTVFTVLLPAVDAPVQAQVPRPAFRLNRQPTVLVVDDDELVRDITSDILRRAGFQVVTVGLGREAISVFAQRHASIDCVVLDLRLPDLSGDEVLMVLRAVEPSIAVVIMSGYSAADRVQGEVYLTASDFVQKPFRPEVLVTSVRNSLRQTPFGNGREQHFDKPDTLS